MQNHGVKYRASGTHLRHYSLRLPWNYEEEVMSILAFLNRREMSCYVTKRGLFAGGECVCLFVCICVCFCMCNAFYCCVKYEVICVCVFVYDVMCMHLPVCVLRHTP